MMRVSFSFWFQLRLKFQTVKTSMPNFKHRNSSLKETFIISSWHGGLNMLRHFQTETKLYPVEKNIDIETKNLRNQFFWKRWYLFLTRSHGQVFSHFHRGNIIKFFKIFNVCLAFIQPVTQRACLYKVNYCHPILVGLRWSH